MKLSLDEYQEQNILDSFDAFNLICKNIFGVKNDKKNTFCTIILLLSLQSIYIFVLFPLAIKKGIILFNTIMFFQSFTPLITLIMTLMTEPGVLIKEKKIKEDQQSQLVPQISTKESNVTTINMDENVDQPRIYKERFCEFCCIMTPPKAAHCRVCNHCVDGFDHHCFWIGNCIGIRNWRIFVIFLTCAAISLFLCFTFGIVLFFYQYSIAIQIWSELFGSFGITVFAFYCLYFITGLWKIAAIMNILFLISMILGPLLYSIFLINNNPKYQNYQYFENPFLLIFVSLIFFVQLMIMFPYVLTNWHNVIYFKTAKQIKSEETFYLSKNLEYKMEQIQWIQIKQNINKFLTYKIPQTRFYII